MESEATRGPVPTGLVMESGTSKGLTLMRVAMESRGTLFVGCGPAPTVYTVGRGRPHPLVLVGCSRAPTPWTADRGQSHFLVVVGCSSVSTPRSVGKVKSHFLVVAGCGPAAFSAENLDGWREPLPPVVIAKSLPLFESRFLVESRSLVEIRSLIFPALRVLELRFLPRF